MLRNDWRIWLIGIFVVLFLLWLLWGRRNQDYEFVGIKPLQAQVPLGNYQDYLGALPSQTSSLTESPVQVTSIPLNNPEPKRVPEPTIKGDTTVIKYIPMFETPVCPRPPEVTVEPQRNTHRSKGEQICCEVMQKIYGKPFNSVRLNCLKNPETGCNLEIDCYNDELKLGVEYNGVQHYIFPNKFHRTKEDFIAQVRRDQYKVEACERAGIYLITVPYNVEYHKIEEYIRTQLPEAQMGFTDI